MCKRLGRAESRVHWLSLPSWLTPLVPTWCQTTLMHAALGELIITASLALIELMGQHACPQVGYPLDSSSWKCGDGLMVPLCSRSARDKAVLVRRAQWGNRSAHDLKEWGRLCNARAQEALVGRANSESNQLPPPLRGWKEKQQSARSMGAVRKPISP